MNEKLKVLIGGAAFVLVILISFLLYQNLSKNYAPQGADRLAGTDVSPAQDNESKEPDASSQAADSAQTGEAQEPERIAAPDFSVEDQEGNTVNFSDFVGKPVVINFWASWCPPCKAEMPEFDTVYRELGDEVTFLMINSTDGGRETVETARAYIDGQDYAFPVYFDTSQEASYLYGISSLPTTVFIDRDGYLITGAMGMIDEATLRRGIDMITDNSALP